jgi:hypothetical protein
MVKVTLDAALLTHLNQVDTALEICDAAGQTVGYFHPAVRRPLGEGPSARSPFSDEELQARRQQRTGRPLADILEQLGRS